MTKFRARLLAGVVLSLASAGAALANPAPTAAPDPVIRTGTWGFDAEGMDRSVKPGDDFWTYANGGFLKALQIPPDKSRYGIDYIMADKAEKRARVLAASAASGPDGASVLSRMPRTRFSALSAMM